MSVDRQGEALGWERLTFLLLDGNHHTVFDYPILSVYEPLVWKDLLRLLQDLVFGIDVFRTSGCRIPY